MRTILVGALVLLSCGCGSRGGVKVGPSSVDAAKHAFAEHGIRLVEAPAAAGNTAASRRLGRAAVLHPASGLDYTLNSVVVWNDATRARLARKVNQAARRATCPQCPPFKDLVVGNVEVSYFPKGGTVDWVRAAIRSLSSPGSPHDDGPSGTERFLSVATVRAVFAGHGDPSLVVPQPAHQATLSIMWPSLEHMKIYLDIDRSARAARIEMGNVLLFPDKGWRYQRVANVVVSYNPGAKATKRFRTAVSDLRSQAAR